MNSNDLRKKFLQYFEGKGHKVLPSASLVPPESDPTALFISAGMHPLVPYLLGQKHHLGQKLINIQKCIRTGDIDEVGDETHLTFFEMLGYWSLGGYWKKEAINYTFDFLTNVLKINLQDLAVTCFEGDDKNNIPKDTESAEIWFGLGISENRIAYLGYEDNFWGPVGGVGPCGPDTEIFVWIGEGEAPETYNPEDKKWLEIGNDVFMAFNKTPDGKFEELKQRNVDFGAGFERIAAYLQKKEIFQTDLFSSLIEEIEKISGKNFEENKKEFRIIADHIKAAVFAINDGANPSNKDRGYIVRRLIRRAIVKANQIGISDNFTAEIAKEVLKTYEGIYFYPSSESEKSESSRQASNNILSELEREETKFRKTLKDGLKILESTVKVSGKDLFNLYQSFGIPSEISLEEIARLKTHLFPDAIAEYEELYKKHQELSRTASVGMFKGGLADAGEKTKKLHTAAHLMLAALRKILGDHVVQKGSNITAERLRFDFSHPEKMTDEQIKKVEDIVNEKIRGDLPVNMEEMSIEDAKNCGAMGVFDSKYGEKVRVYTIGGPSTPPTSWGRSLREPEGSSEPRTAEPPFSREICGGPHAACTGELGHFKIVKEESSSAGIRRIKAVLE